MNKELGRTMIRSSLCLRGLLFLRINYEKISRTRCVTSEMRDQITTRPLSTRYNEGKQGNHWTRPWFKIISKTYPTFCRLERCYWVAFLSILIHQAWAVTQAKQFDRQEKGSDLSHNLSSPVGSETARRFKQVCECVTVRELLFLNRFVLEKKK
jgi:hypothetical protein